MTATTSAREAGRARKLGPLGESALAVRQLGPDQQFPVPSSIWLVDAPPPDLELNYRPQPGPWLKWEAFTRGARVRRTPPIRGCLAAFDRLATGTPEQVLHFASTWGVIGLCRHGLPSTHRSEDSVWCYPLGLSARSSRSSVEPAVAWEPVSAYIERALKVHGLVRLMERFNEGRATAEADWRDAELVRPADPRDVPAEFAAEVNEWLADAAVTPRVQWDANKKVFAATLEPAAGILREAYGALFYVLSVQLAGALSGELFTCTRCDGIIPIDPNGRRPHRNRGRYCGDDCREAARNEQKLALYRKKGDTWPSVIQRRQGR